MDVKGQPQKVLPQFRAQFLHKTAKLWFLVLNMVGRAEWTQAQECQKSPNAQGHWVTSDFL